MAKPKAKKKKNTKDLLDAFDDIRKLRRLPELDWLPKVLRSLFENWDSLPKLNQDLILILGRVNRITHAAKGKVRVEATGRRHKRGAEPEWLVMALTILKDSKGYLSDSEIARRVGVHRSTLCRNETYRNARRTYMQPFATIGRRGVYEKSESENF